MTLGASVDRDETMGVDSRSYFDVLHVAQGGGLRDVAGVILHALEEFTRVLGLASGLGDDRSTEETSGFRLLLGRQLPVGGFLSIVLPHLECGFGGARSSATGSFECSG